MAFRIPVKFGVWYMHTSTLSGPNSWINEASRVAHDGLGVSRVPRSASVRKETFSVGVFFKASRIDAIWHIVSKRCLMGPSDLLAHARTCQCRVLTDIFCFVPSISWSTLYGQ